MADTGVTGHTIARVRPMTEDEMDQEGWEAGRRGVPMALVLDNGVVIFPSRDMEGNGPGALFARDADGEGMFVVEGA
jgi:hypothetical protein